MNRPTVLVTCLLFPAVGSAGISMVSGVQSMSGIAELTPDVARKDYSAAAPDPIGSWSASDSARVEDAFQPAWGEVRTSVNTAINPDVGIFASTGFFVEASSGTFQPYGAARGIVTIDLLFDVVDPTPARLEAGLYRNPGGLIIRQSAKVLFGRVGDAPLINWDTNNGKNPNDPDEFLLPLRELVLAPGQYRLLISQDESHAGRQGSVSIDSSFRLTVPAPGMAMGGMMALGIAAARRRR